MRHEGTSYFKDLTRKDYIAQASKIIKEEGVSAVSIRRIAKEMNCSSASLYRHFENLDELLYYAHLSSLNEYIIDLSAREKGWKNMWETHFGIWSTYAENAFQKPEAFDSIFYKKNPGKALKEYYQMFPDAIVQVGPKIKEMLEISGYYERDYYMCTCLAAEGKILLANAGKLNHMICTLFLGYFKYVQEKRIEQHEIPELIDQFMDEVHSVASLYAIDTNFKALFMK